MSFGPGFATEARFLAAAWDLVVLPIGLAPAAGRALFAAWASAHTKGDPRAENKALSAALKDTDWRWPWFDASAEGFDQDGEWPHMWLREGLETEKARAEVQPRCVILAHTLSMTAYRMRDMADDAMKDLARRRGGYRLSVVAGCPVEARVAAQHAASIEAGDMSRLPPFFPGDRTTIAIKRR